MPQARQAGVLMHITSLPAGNMGPDAYRFCGYAGGHGGFRLANPAGQYAA